jgi:hypothetical protein
MATSTLGSGTLVLAGTTSGTTTVTATAVAGTTTLTLPAATDTLVGKATTDTLTNKTLTGAAMNGTLGATTPSTGAFTTVSATGNFTFGGNLNSTLTSEFYLQSPNGNNFIGVNETSAYVRVAASGQVVLNLSNTAALFYLGGTEKMSLTTTGLKTASTISVGNATPSTSGAGITFPATQSASTNANTLDDYEEGTYTVTLTPQTSGTITLSSTINEGAYTKIGRVVTITAQVGIDSVSSPNGSYIDFSIPFPIANLTDNAGRVYFAGVYQQGGAPFTTSINRVLGIETFSTVRFYITAATVAAGDELGIAFSYFTD